MTKPEVYHLIEEERCYQDKKWGGPKHDKQHSVADWIVFMEIFLGRAKQSLRISQADALADIVKVTALGVACLESRCSVESHGLEIAHEAK
jgi:hypothetical protein